MLLLSQNTPVTARKPVNHRSSLVTGVRSRRTMPKSNGRESSRAGEKSHEEDSGGMLSSLTLWERNHERKRANTQNGKSIICVKKYDSRNMTQESVNFILSKMVKMELILLTIMFRQVNCWCWTWGTTERCFRQRWWRFIWYVNRKRVALWWRWQKPSTLNPVDTKLCCQINTYLLMPSFITSSDLN